MPDFDDIVTYLIVGGAAVLGIATLIGLAFIHFGFYADAVKPFLR